MLLLADAGLIQLRPGIGYKVSINDVDAAVMVIASREENRDDERYKKFVQIYQSQAIRDFMQQTFNGTIEPAFE